LNKYPISGISSGDSGGAEGLIKNGNIL